MTKDEDTREPASAPIANPESSSELIQRLKEINDPNIKNLLEEPQFRHLLEEHSPEFQTIVTVAARAQFQGPIPPPSTLEGYERVVVGSAERIISMAEKEQSHRHDMDKENVSIEKTYLNNERNRDRLGQWFGAGISLFSLSLATYLAIHGQPVVGGIIGGTTVVALVTAFVVGRVVSDKSDQDSEDNAS